MAKGKNSFFNQKRQKKLVQTKQRAKKYFMATTLILHVEDDPDDAFFLVRSMKKTMPDCEFRREVNGEGTIDYLRRALDRPSRSHPIPSVMVLDLKLPGLSGFEVLSWTRAQPGLAGLPVIVLSGSSLEQDRIKALELGASDFIVKASKYDLITERVANLLSSKGLLASKTPPSFAKSPTVAQSQ